jgi:hypothetical protein
MDASNSSLPSPLPAGLLLFAPNVEGLEGVADAVLDDNSFPPRRGVIREKIEEKWVRKLLAMMGRIEENL